MPKTSRELTHPNTSQDKKATQNSQDKKDKKVTCQFRFWFCLRPISGFAYRPDFDFWELGHYHPSRQSGQSALSTNEK